MFLSEPLAFAVLFALVLDGLFGDPSWLYRRLPHPVALMGKAIGWLDRVLHSQTLSAKMLYRRGRLMTIGLIVVGMLTGFALQWLCSQLDYGWILLGILMSSLLAQKSLADHVGAVDRGLDRGLDDGRAAVAHIVGRDPEWRVPASNRSLRTFPMAWSPLPFGDCYSASRACWRIR